MADQSAIEWTDATFNPWIGCSHVSPGCQHCYAETLMDTRYGRVAWGERGERSRTAPSYWRKPLAWNRQAEAVGERRRVFCASLADVFDPHPSILPEWRAELWALIEATPWLDWQLLTKRPERVLEMVPEDWRERFPGNVRLGTSVEDQRRADERIPELLRVPAAVRFLSCEPLLGAVDLGMTRPPRDDDYSGWDGDGPIDFVRTVTAMGLHWVIVGGESGPGARPCDLSWFKGLVDQCWIAGVPCFVKQLGARPFVATIPGRGLTGSLLELRDRKGGDPSEWPQELRVREFPVARIRAGEFEE